MTDNTQPEALIDLIDAYAETRHRCGGIYNARTEAARNAVTEALSGVQALSAAPAEQQAATKAAPGVGNSGFDHQTAADFLSGKTVSDEAVRKFVQAARWAHDEKAALSAMLLSVRGVLASREAEIALLKTALMEAEAAPQQEAQEPTTVDKKTMELAESVGLIGPASRVGDLHAAIQRFHDLICVNATIKAAVMAAEAIGKQQAAPQQEAQEPCPTCVALARAVMLDQVSFDRKPDCYGIRQITDDEGVEEWEDIRTSPDVAREEANDIMATGRGEIYEVAPLWTTPQPAPASLSESIDQIERALAIIGVVGAIDGHDVVRRESVLEIARRAALAAQGGKDA